MSMPPNLSGKQASLPLINRKTLELSWNHLDWRGLAPALAQG